MPKITDANRAKLNKALKAREASQRREPLWKGPLEDGVTQSLLSRFLACRERFRLLVVEGLKVDEGFNHKLEYGNMWHACEEALAAGRPWEPSLLQYCRKLAQTNHSARKDIEKWYQVCKIQFPRYVAYWRKHPDVKNRTPYYQEKVFDEEYTLPSGRVVLLRGKFDAVDVIDKALWLQENKSKGDVNLDRLRIELPYDLQTHFYLLALRLHEAKKVKELGKEAAPYRVAGVRYNVVRRPLSGRLYNIVQKKGRGKARVGAETNEEFYDRLGKVIDANSADFFVRFRMEVTDNDLGRFNRMSLDPILEQLCDWWEYIKSDPFDPWKTRKGPDYTPDNVSGPGLRFPPDVPNNLHFMLPYGIYNPTLEGKPGDLDEYIARGDERGLIKTDTLFSELEE